MTSLVNKKFYFFSFFFHFFSFLASFLLIKRIKKVKTMLFKFLFLFSGFLTISRNIYIVLGLLGLMNLLSSIRICSLIITIFCLIMFFIFQLEAPLNYFIFSLLSLSSFLLKPLAQSYLKQKMQYHLNHILNILVLKMRSGHSFSSAFQSICKENDTIIQKKLRNIASLLKYWNEKQVKTLKGFDLEIVLRLHEIMQSSSHRLNQVIHLRNEIKMRNDFQKQSIQAALQTRLQSLLLIGIYIVIAILMSKTYGFDLVKLWIFLSLLPMLLGTYILMTIPKRFKWKI